MSIQSRLFESSRQARQRLQWKILNGNLRILSLVLEFLAMPTLVLHQTFVTHVFDVQLWTLVNVAAVGNFLLWLRAWKNGE